MREIEQILKKYRELKMAKTEAILATVVHVEGSSYRRAGARMLVDELGNITGAISGGCLEGDALRKALLAMHQRKNKLVTYDTSDEDDAVIGAQLGCNGIIQVLFEPIDFENAYNACEMLQKAVDSDKKQAIVIGFNLDRTAEQPGTILLIDEETITHGMHISAEQLEILKHEAKLVLQGNDSQFVEFEGASESSQFFIQNYQPPVKLILVGAGNDAQILALQAELLGWKVSVTDGRPSHANSTRFSGSCQLIVSKPEKTLENLKIDNRSCFVLMSHNYNYDLAVLKLLLQEQELPYIGILGPKKKYDRMLKDLAEEDIQLSEALLKKIHAPVGLEIGAETPAEIGLSILAEIQSVLAGKEARPLKEKDAPIHEKRGKQFKRMAV